MFRNLVTELYINKFFITDIFYILCIGEIRMRKSIILISLVLVSLLALNNTILMSFASEPNAVIDPTNALPGEDFSFEITATSWSTVTGIEAEDPDGNTWVLKGLTSYGWRTVKIWLKDDGDSIQLTWPEASFTVLNDPDNDVIIRSKWGSSITDLAWVNDDDKLPHTQVMGTYGISFSGIGCIYFHVDSFFVVPEFMLGTAGAMIASIAGLGGYILKKRNA